jgi:hypothetical protein
VVDAFVSDIGRPVAIWDNRSAFHTATLDYDGQGERYGNRVVGVGERPFYDPSSKSRRDALEEEYFTNGGK